MATQVCLSIKGEIIHGPDLFYGGKDKELPCCKLTIPYQFRQRKDLVEIRFPFIAFGRLAEHIGLHYRRYQIIHIMRAYPSRDRYLTREGRVRYRKNWVIYELGRLRDMPEDDAATLTEVNLKKQ